MVVFNHLHMKKRNKIIIGVVVVLLLASTVVLAVPGDLFQGRLQSSRPTLALFSSRGRVVSVVTTPVTSAVPSVVVSSVVSRRGIASRVPSVVVSPVASPVASAVMVDARTAASVDIRSLKELSVKILQTIAREDYINNRAKYALAEAEYYRNNPKAFKLSQEEINRILKLYRPF